MTELVITTLVTSTVKLVDGEVEATHSIEIRSNRDIEEIPGPLLTAIVKNQARSIEDGLEDATVVPD